MARSCKETTNRIYKLIIFQHNCKAIQNMAKLVNLSHSIVHYVIKHFKEENGIENKVSKSQLSKLTKCNKKFIIRKFVKNPHLTAVKVIAEFNEKFSTLFSPETVRVLRATADLPSLHRL